MYSDEQIKEFAIDILKLIEQRYNCQEAEVFIQSISQTQGGTEFRTPKVIQSTHRVGCAIRYYKEKKLYFSCFSLPNALQNLEKVLSFQKFPIKTDYFTFPEIKKPLAPVENIYDKKIALLNLDEITDLSLSLRQFDEEEDNLILDGTILLTKERRAIANSTHSLAFEKGTWFNIDLRALYRGFNMISSGESHHTSRLVPKTIKQIVDSLVMETIQRSHKKTKLTNFLLPLIFSPKTFTDILAFTLVPNLTKNNSHNIRNMQFSDNFNLIDDGTLPGLPNSTAFDDEGVLQSKTVLFEKGKMVNYLNNSQHREENEEQTGNSFRISMYELFPRNYQSYPDIYPSNLILGRGNKSFGDIISEFGEGIFINNIQGHIPSDPISGDFNISTIDAYLIENGAIASTLPSFTISGNLYDILKNNPRFTSDKKVIRPFSTPYSILAPYLVTNCVSIYP